MINCTNIKVDFENQKTIGTPKLNMFPLSLSSLCPFFISIIISISYIFLNIYTFPHSDSPIRNMFLLSLFYSLLLYFFVDRTPFLLLSIRYYKRLSSAPSSRTFFYTSSNIFMSWSCWSASLRALLRRMGSEGSLRMNYCRICW